MRSVIVGFLLVCASTLACGELFTALTHMRGLIRLEKTLQRKLVEYLNLNPRASEDLRITMEEVKQHTKNIRGDVEKFLGHPVNAYMLIRRFIKNWKDVEEYLEKHDDQEDLLALLRLHKVDFPTSKDMLGCVQAIQRIQDVYNITAKRIASGHLSDITSTPPMSADSCFEIGYAHHRWEKHEEARQWMEESLRRLDPPFRYRGSLQKQDILEFIAWSEYMTEREDLALAHTSELLQLDPNNDFAARNLEFFLQEYQAKANGSTKKPNIFKKPPPPREHFMEAYERLCRGISYRSNEEAAKLRCYYDFTRHPMFRIRPLKVEELHSDPPIWMLRDVMYDSEIEYIKRTATPKLRRATVTNLKTGELEFADYRISKSGWLEDPRDDNEEKILNRVNRRTSIITGLDTTPRSAEALQIVNYGAAGHYEPHFDHATEAVSSILKLGIGNRIATVLYYMSDVEAGGATVFVDAEAIVKPSKGDAAFWYNLHKNGKGDERTRHAACPIIVGSKWVCNKWIHEHGQEFRRPCGLSIEE
ncbi:predicted protein [Nematostella vectensis]|uniref:procollagen-proline 4-dioxygenase n=1 Tax=Nematostella vectensis TaxID=45351 RepID=A7T0N3_NEMVE|nr:prolyl 4-hydroxylase subunit alpha-1 [Nematostella vectensis]EDO30487.1 predicted protein [Nematostella vectensis]|eukprot:XP_001622587.1 predicted protein [Nematostella vectensis]